MTSPDGGFYSAEDADSEGKEGKFYVWSKKEIDFIFGEDANLFTQAYDVSEQGNWESKNILRIKRDWASVAKEFNLDSVAMESTSSVIEPCAGTPMIRSITGSSGAPGWEMLPFWPSKVGISKSVPSRLA